MSGVGIRAQFWVMMLVLGLSACGTQQPTNAKLGRSGTRVTVERLSTASSGSFTLPVGTDLPGLGTVSGVLRAPSGSGPATYRGDRPGLYADTRANPSCDLGRLGALLLQNPREATVWASTLGIQSSQIRSYLATLTPVVLRSDTRVTNHGYVNGAVTTIQSVLQAGTAVAVDRHGEPVAKCYCGNPLTAALLSAKSSYTGPEWSGFSQQRMAVIQRSKNFIHTFILYDPSANQMFRRRAGTYISTGGGSYSTTSTTSTSNASNQAPSTSSPADQTPSTTSPSEQTPSTSTTTQQTPSRNNPAQQTHSATTTASYTP